MTITTRRSRPMSELFDWIESGWPAMAMLRQDGMSAMRIEDVHEDARYVVRAELPGIDPEKDVEITVADGVLTITAEREEKMHHKGGSEFHYGTFQRRMPLPAGAEEEKLAASYTDGILEVVVPVSPESSAARVVPITRT
jgi:HSP20 family protein